MSALLSSYPRTDGLDERGRAVGAMLAQSNCVGEKAALQTTPTLIELRLRDWPRTDLRRFPEQSKSR